MNEKNINTKDLQKEINELFIYYNNYRESMYDCKDKIKSLGRQLLCELRKIDGWESMIQSCYEHYQQYPDKFFDWCEVELFNNNIITFEKGYVGDSDSYIVLKIRTDIPLEQQVADAVKNKRDIEESKNKEERDKKYKEYLKLKEEFENL